MNNQQLLERLDKTVSGHEKAKKQLINAVRRQQRRFYENYLEGSTPLKGDQLPNADRLLIVGGSGTGKTLLIEELSKLMKFPFLRIDASKFDLPDRGSEGMSAKQFRDKIIKFAEQQQQEDPYHYFSTDGTLDKMVVFIDEVDKMCMSFDSTGNWNNRVQSSFLTILGENDKRLGGVLFVMAGAFAGVTEKKRKEVKGNSIGFFRPSHTEAAKPLKENLKQIDITSEDLIEYGMLPEFAGRISSIAALDLFNEEDYATILKMRVLPAKNEELEKIGEKLYLTKEQVSAASKEAMRSGQGVRYLKRWLNDLSIDLEFNVVPKVEMNP